MVKAGIIDPAKVTRGALENAASIAAMILTTEALITDIPADEPPMMPPGGGMPGGAWVSKKFKLNTAEFDEKAPAFNEEPFLFGLGFCTLRTGRLRLKRTGIRRRLGLT